MAETLVTPDGLEKLTAQLEQLRLQYRALGERIRNALEQGGDLAENGDYLDARGEQAQLERRIALLEERLAFARVVQPDTSDGQLGIGERVRVRDLDSGETVEYRLVGAAEADPAAGRISYESPVGSALLGRRVGDTVEIQIPHGVLRLEIVEIDI